MLIEKLTSRLPYVRTLVEERNRLRSECERLTNQLGAAASLWLPPGHFSSPIASLDEVRAREHQIFAPPPRTLPGIDLDEEGQLRLFDEFTRYYAEIPWGAEARDGLRYWFANDWFSWGDGISLYCMLRHLRPKRIIEVGSGFSSAVTLDTNDRFLGGAVQCTFIEPYPDRLRSLLRQGDAQRARILEMPLQDVPREEFAALEANDILFIDSSHVAKVHSDVNLAFFEILPLLQPGVYVHFHDVFYPFEYPREWVFEGRNWNEAYMLRAFLQFNAAFRVRWFTTFLTTFHRERFVARMPAYLNNPGGSIWIARNG